MSKTSINWELKDVTFGGNVYREYYEEKLWNAFKNIHKFASDSYTWLDAWENNTLLWSKSSMDVGYKAIYKWVQAQAKKSTSPIWAIRMIHN